MQVKWCNDFITYDRVKLLGWEYSTAKATITLTGIESWRDDQYLQWCAPSSQGSEAHDITEVNCHAREAFSRHRSSQLKILCDWSKRRQCTTFSVLEINWNYWVVNLKQLILILRWSHFSNKLSLRTVGFLYNFDSFKLLITKAYYLVNKFAPVINHRKAIKLENVYCLEKVSSNGSVQFNKLASKINNF